MLLGCGERNDDKMVKKQDGNGISERIGMRSSYRGRKNRMRELL
jgi:hypothetical protein